MDKSFDPTFQIDTEKYKKHSKTAKLAAEGAVQCTVSFGDKIKGIFTSKKNKDEVKNTAEKTNKKISTLSNKFFGSGKSSGSGGLTISEAFGSKSIDKQENSKTKKPQKNYSPETKKLAVNSSSSRRSSSNSTGRSTGRQQHSQNSSGYSSTSSNAYLSNSGKINSTQVNPGPALHGYPQSRRQSSSVQIRK